MQFETEEEKVERRSSNKVIEKKIKDLEQQELLLEAEKEAVVDEKTKV